MTFAEAAEAGPVHVSTLGIDLAKLPALDPAPMRAWAARLTGGA